MSEDLHRAETSEANQSENVSPKRTTTTQKTFVKLRVDGCVTLKEKGTLTFSNVIQCFIKRGDGIPPFTLGNLFGSKGSSKCHACLTITNLVFVILTSNKSLLSVKIINKIRTMRRSSHVLASRISKIDKR